MPDISDRQSVIRKKEDERRPANKDRREKRTLDFNTEIKEARTQKHAAVLRAYPVSRGTLDRGVAWPHVGRSALAG